MDIGALLGALGPVLNLLGSAAGGLGAPDLGGAIRAGGSLVSGAGGIYGALQDEEPTIQAQQAYSPAVQQATEKAGAQLDPRDVAMKYQTFRRDRAAQGLAGLNPSAMLQQYAESLGILVEQLLEILQQSGQGM